MREKDRFTSRAGRAGAGLTLLLTGLVASLAVGTTAASATTTPAWQQLTPATNPPALVAPSMAYDAATHQLVLTGEVPSDTTNETWVWSGSNWSKLSPAASPPARSGASMAYDPNTGQLVLFGGLSSGAPLHDTWSWNGTTWAPASPATSPSAREGAEMAFDTSTAQLVLFGGFDGTNFLDDTWTWSGTNWTQVGLTEPSNFTGRAFSAMAYDQASGQLHLFSGFGAAGQFYSDNWVWTGSAWSQISGGGPGASGGDSMAFDPDINELVLFGGDGSANESPGGDNANFWGWTGGAFTPLTGGPPARAFAAMAYDPDSTQLILFGGNNPNGLNDSDTWVYTSPANCSTSSFSDNFSLDTGLSSSCWQTETPLISAVESKIGATDVSPNEGLSFGDGAMLWNSVDANNELSAIQSTNAYAAPFQFNASVSGAQGEADVFAIYLVNASTNQAFAVEGDPDANDSGYGLWANNGLPANSSDVALLSPNTPSFGATYNISMSIDASGDGSVMLNGGTPHSVGHVGAGPFYVLLGQHEAVPSDTSGSANEANWFSASLNTTCGSTNGFSDDFADDTSLNLNCWQTGTPILSTIATDVGDASYVTPQLGFNAGDMDMQGASSNPTFTGIQSTTAYSAPFDFQATVKGIQSGDNSFGIYIVGLGEYGTNGSLTALTVEGNQSSTGEFNGVFANNELNQSGQQELLSHQSVNTTYHIDMSIDRNAQTSVTVNGVTVRLGGVGNGPYEVVLGQRETDEYYSGGEVQLTGPNEAAWYSASMTTNYDCTATDFSDNFASDSALSGCWQDPELDTSTEGTTAVGVVADNNGSATGPPNLTFSAGTQGTGNGYMQMSGTGGDNDMVMIQSTNAYTAPFQFDTTVAGQIANLEPIGIYLVNTGTGQSFSLEGNLNPNSSAAQSGFGSRYGFFASNGTEPDWTGIPVLTPNTPATGVEYDISMSVDGSGNDTVSIDGGTPVSVGNVGNGPFYVVLGERAGEPTSGIPEQTAWYSASLTPPGALSASLSTTSSTVNAIESVPASALPTTSVDGSSGTGSGDAAAIPLHSIPLHSIGLAASPLHSIPLHSIPLHSIAVPGSDSAIAGAQAALSSTLLSDLSVTYPDGCTGTACTGWAGVLAGSAYAGLPLESVTLADVLTDPVADANFETLNLGDLDVSSSPLGSIPLSSIALGATTLSSIPLPGSSSGTSALSAWCTELASLNFDCSSQFGINASTGNDNGATLLSLALAGVPLHSIPLSSIPLHSIDLSTSPLSSIPLSSIDLASNPIGSIPLHSIPLSSIPLHSIPLSSIPLHSIPLGSVLLSSITDLSAVVNCSTYPSCATGTLAQAADAGAILSSATLGDLGSYGETTIGDLPSSTFGTTTVGELLTGDTTGDPDYPDLTLGDLLLSTVPPASYPWPTVTLANLPLAASASAAQTVTYTANLTVMQQTGTVQVSLSLPPSFSYVAGSAELDGSPISDPAGTSTLTWTFDQLTGGSHSLTLKANPGLNLGSATATLSASIGGTAIPTATAPVQVVDAEEPDDTAATATVLTPGTPPLTNGNINIGYLTSPGDLNDWSVTVPAGDELSLALTNLPATYDLELFGPNGLQLQGAPDQDLSGVSDTLPSLTPGTTTEATPGSQDLPVTPPAGYQLEAVSNNPDAQSQYIQTPPLAGGTYYVQVSGYNGAYSSQPYLLAGNLLGGATAPSCPGGISYLANLAPSTATAPTIPAGVNTLFLVDTQRLTAAFPGDESTIMSDLQTVASDSADGVVGAVVPVDAYPSVQSAYATWNDNPCSVDGANGVTAAISAVVDQLRASNPTIQNIVIVGGDDQIPFARIADGASESNERDYGAATFAGENNVEGDALSLGYYFSDDPYAADAPLGVGSATLYLPQLAVGRLVASASEIEDSLTRFVTYHGDINANTALTTGYSFLSSGAEAVSTNLAADGLSSSDACNLINESWTESELDTALAGTTNCPAPGVIGLNAHFDYSRALPAYGNTNATSCATTTTDAGCNLFTTTDISDPKPSTSFDNTLLFSMGCHAGLDISDAEVSVSGVPTPVEDWAKTFADSGALWVANTGYGYADTDTIAYSAKLMAAFAGNLGSLTVGEALTAAKQQYAAGNAVLSPYDLKALMESTFYGLPMYRLNTPTGPVAPPQGPTTSTDPVTGLTIAPVSLTPSTQLVNNSANGNFYQVTGSGGGTQTTEYRPIEPLVSVPATEPNLVPHGALVTGLSSTDTADFQPTYSMPAAGAADSSPPAIGDAAFPGTLQRVATYGTFTSSGTSQAAQLDLVAGQFFPNPSSTTGAGTQRLFTSMQADVYYLPTDSPLVNDYTPATIDSSQVVNSGGSFNFSVQVTPSGAPVERVLVLYTDAADPGVWTPVDLTSTDGLTWTGPGPATASGEAQYFVQAVDAASNVSVSNNEGVDFNGHVPTTTTLSTSANPSLTGEQVGFTASVGASVDGGGGPGGNVVFLDGGVPITACGGTSGESLSETMATCYVSYNSPGSHQISAEYLGDANFSASTTTAPISETVDQATVAASTSLHASTTSPMLGQVVTYTAVVSGRSGGATPTGLVTFEDGSNPITCAGGSQTLSGSANSATATCKVTYNSSAGSPHSITAVYVPGSDPNYTAGAPSNTVSVTVGTTAASTSLGASTTSPAVGQLVTYTATVSGPTNGATPTGSVTFEDGSNPITCTGGDQTLSGSANTATATCQVTYTSTAGNPHSITAVYVPGSDANYTAGATSNTVSVTVGTAIPTELVTTLPASPTLGQQVTYTATVTGPPGAATPSGTLTWTLTGPVTSCASTTGPTGSSNVATYTCVITASKAGNYSATAGYPGDSNYGSNSGSDSFTVSKVAASTSLGASTTSPALGQLVTYTATVSGPPGGATPTGTVTFKDGSGTITCAGGSQTLSGSANIATATCQVTYTSMTGSTHSITAVYVPGSDPNYTAGTASTPVTVTVGKATPATSLKLSASSGTYGNEQKITFTATLTPPASGLPTPTGTITVMTGSTTLCTITLPATTCTTTATKLPASANPYLLSAFYGGDGNFTSSTSSSVPLTVNQDSTATVLQGLPLSVAYGSEQKAVFGIAVLTGNGEPLPATEPVTITVGTASCIASMTPSVLGAYGSCSIAATALQVGSYKVTAAYAGDTDLKSSSGTAAVGLTVTGAATTTSVGVSSATVTYGNETTEMFSTTVTSSAGTPTGTVTVGSSAGTLCQIALANGSGNCRLTATQLAVGSVTKVVATYAASGNFAGSASSSSQSFSVSKDSTTTKVSESPTTVTYGSESASVFTVTVTSGHAEAIPNGETLKVTVGSATCTVTLSGGTGTCKLSNTALQVGSYAVSAAYAGDTNLGSSSGSSSTKLTVSRS